MLERSVMAMRGDELTLRRLAESVALKVDLFAQPGMVIEVEQRITNRPGLHCRYQDRNTLATVGGQRSDCRDLETTQFDKAPRQFFARKDQRTRPRLILFLKRDQRAVGVEQ